MAWQGRQRQGDTMSAIAAAGQTYADVIEAKLESQLAWMRLAHQRLLACSEDDDPIEYRWRVDDFYRQHHRYLALADLAHDCGLRPHR